MSFCGYRACSTQWLAVGTASVLLLACNTAEAAEVVAGPAFSRVGLTLEPGERVEAAGPFYYRDEVEDETRWAVPPLISYAGNHGIDSVEFDVFYPALTYDRFGSEYRFQVLQLLSFAGGQLQTETNRTRFSLYPLFLQQSSPDDSQDYISILPFYGHVYNRFFRDEVQYVLMPLWVRSRKRDVVTDNYLWPIFHVRRGPGLHGWQAWPVFGTETKVPTQTTNHWGDEIVSPGHQNRFVLWPFFLDQRSGIGGTNEGHTHASLPFYSFTRSPMRDSTAVPFVLGWSSVVDREKKYTERGFPWPLVVFRRGENTRIDRIWPVYSKATNQFLESSWLMWPLYKYNRVTSAPLDRERTRYLLFLYSDTIERNTEAGTAQRRRDCWPLFIHRQDWNGNQRLQVLALLEPVLPNSKSIERNYSPVYALWRSEFNAKTGARSRSLLWNLYRSEQAAEESHVSAFFGLVQRSSGTNGPSWRFFWWPDSNSAK